MSLFGGLISLGSKVSSALKNTAEKVKNMVSSGARKVGEVLSKVGSACTEGASYLAGKAKETASKAIHIMEKAGATVKTFISSGTSAPKAKEVADRSASAQNNVGSGVTSNRSNTVDVNGEPSNTAGVKINNMNNDQISGATYIASQKEIHSQEAPGKNSAIENEIQAKTIPEKPSTQKEVAKKESEAKKEIQEENKNVIENFIDWIKSIPSRAWGEIKELGNVAKEKAKEAAEKVVEGAKGIAGAIASPFKSASEAISKWLPLIATVGVLVGVAYFARTFFRRRY